MPTALKSRGHYYRAPLRRAALLGPSGLLDKDSGATKG